MIRGMTAAAGMAALVMLGGCGGSDENRQELEARAAKSGFVPPAVTSRLDYGGEMERRFRALDRNGNDELSEEEWPRQDSRIQLLDRNRDGVVTASEWSEGMLDRFDQMDINRDGTVTSDEEREYRDARAKGQIPGRSQTTPGPLLPGG
jgi:hypothetical protein